MVSRNGETNQPTKPARVRRRNKMSDSTNPEDAAIKEMLGVESGGTENEQVEAPNASDANTSEESAQTEEKATEIDWKDKARQWESRSKANHKEAEDLKAQLSNLETELTELKNVKAEADNALHQLMVYKVAAEHGISNPDDIELFLTGKDEETLKKQAERISQSSSRSPRPDSAQGKRTGGGTQTNAEVFAQTLNDLL